MGWQFSTAWVERGVLLEEPGLSCVLTITAYVHITTISIRVALIVCFVVHIIGLEDRCRVANFMIMCCSAGPFMTNGQHISPTGA